LTVEDQENTTTLIEFRCEYGTPEMLS